MKSKDAVLLIKEIDDTDVNLNDWENYFLQNMRDWVDRGTDLSEKQAECLRKIYQKATEGETYR